MDIDQFLETEDRWWKRLCIIPVSITLQ